MLMYLPKVNKNMFPKILYTNVHGKLIHKSIGNNPGIYQQEKGSTTVTYA